MAGNPRHGAVIKIKTGVKKNGLMIAEHIEFVFDSGAYGGYRPQGYWWAPTMRRDPIAWPIVWSRKNTSTPTRCLPVICARRAICRLFSPPRAKRFGRQALGHGAGGVSPNEFHA
jgi:hypothetical protein